MIGRTLACHRLVISWVFRDVPQKDRIVGIESPPPTSHDCPGRQRQNRPGGGPLWRYLDKDNYYVARINPLESNYRLYKVLDGKRIKLASADVELAEDDPRVDDDDALLKRWHLIRVVHKGSRIRCYLNGKLLLEAEDTSIKSAGKVGFWTKADAVTGFDAMRVAAAKK